MTRHVSPRQRRDTSTERARYWYDHAVKPIVQEKHCSVEKAYEIIEERRARTRELVEKFNTEPALTEEELEELHELWDAEAEESPDAG